MECASQAASVDPDGVWLSVHVLEARGLRPPRQEAAGPQVRCFVAVSSRETFEKCPRLPLDRETDDAVVSATLCAESSLDPLWKGEDGVVKLPLPFVSSRQDLCAALMCLVLHLEEDGIAAELGQCVLSLKEAVLGEGLVSRTGDCVLGTTMWRPLTPRLPHKKACGKARFQATLHVGPEARRALFGEDSQREGLAKLAAEARQELRDQRQLFHFSMDDAGAAGARSRSGSRERSRSRGRSAERERMSSPKLRIGFDSPPRYREVLASMGDPNRFSSDEFEASDFLPQRAVYNDDQQNANGDQHSENDDQHSENDDQQNENGASEEAGAWNSAPERENPACAKHSSRMRPADPCLSRSPARSAQSDSPGRLGDFRDDGDLTNTAPGDLEKLNGHQFTHLELRSRGRRSSRSRRSVGGLRRLSAAARNFMRPKDGQHIVSRQWRETMLAALDRLQARETQVEAFSEIAGLLLSPQCGPKHAQALGNALVSPRSEQVGRQRVGSRVRGLQILRLLCQHHAEALAQTNLFSSMIRLVLNRLRDSEESVRSAAAEAAGSLALYCPTFAGSGGGDFLPSPTTMQATAAATGLRMLLEKILTLLRENARGTKASAADAVYALVSPTSPQIVLSIRVGDHAYRHLSDAIGAAQRHGGEELAALLRPRRSSMPHAKRRTRPDPLETLWDVRRRRLHLLCGSKEDAEALHQGLQDKFALFPPSWDLCPWPAEEIERLQGICQLHRKAARLAAEQILKALLRALSLSGATAGEGIFEALIFLVHSAEGTDDEGGLLAPEKCGPLADALSACAVAIVERCVRVLNPCQSVKMDMRPKHPEKAAAARCLQEVLRSPFMAAELQDLLDDPIRDALQIGLRDQTKAVRESCKGCLAALEETAYALAEREDVEEEDAAKVTDYRAKTDVSESPRRAASAEPPNAGETDAKARVSVERRLGEDEVDRLNASFPRRKRADRGRRRLELEGRRRCATFPASSAEMADGDPQARPQSLAAGIDAVRQLKEIQQQTSTLERSLDDLRRSAKHGFDSLEHRVERLETESPQREEATLPKPTRREESQGPSPMRMAVSPTLDLWREVAWLMKAGEVAEAFDRILKSGDARDLVRLLHRARSLQIKAIHRQLSFDTCDRLFASVAAHLNGHLYVDHLLPLVFDLVAEHDAYRLSRAVRRALAQALYNLSAAPEASGELACRMWPLVGEDEVERSAWRSIEA